MAVNGNSNVSRVTSPFARAFQAAKAKISTKPAPQAAGDANKTEGKVRYDEGVKAAKTGELNALPFGNTWWGALKYSFIKVRTQTEDEKSAAFKERWSDKFGPEGQQAIERVANDTTAKGIKLRNEVNKFLKKGGDPEGAAAILKQVQAPNQNIEQVNEMTCAAATAQKALARKDPAKYFRIMADLAGDGQCKFPGLGVIQVGKESLKDIRKSDLGTSNRLNALMQSALMEKFNGTANYDFSDDVSTYTNGKGKETERRGLNTEQAESLAEALVECNVIDPSIFKHGIQEAEKRGLDRKAYMTHRLTKVAADAEKAGDPGFFIAINTKKGKAHMVLVRSIDAANGSITFEDARGHVKTRNLNSFLGRVALSDKVEVGGGRVRVASAVSTGDV